MKQTEKLDLILKALYEKPGNAGEIIQLLNEKGIDVSLDDAYKLGRRLDDAGYVKFVATRDSAWVDIKSEGIEFVEGDSFTLRGQSVITNNYSISNSPNANLISHSSQVSITQNVDSIKQTIDQIKEEIDRVNLIDPKKRQELTECLQEVEVGISAGKAPKYAFKALTELAADFASVGSLVLQLGQLTGLLLSAS